MNTIAPVGYEIRWTLFGIKKDRSVIICGNDKSNLINRGWKNIVGIKGCSNHIVGLKYDGTVEAKGKDENEYGYLKIGGWSRIGTVTYNEHCLQKMREELKLTDF